MKMAEILRKMADILDTKETDHPVQSQGTPPTDDQKPMVSPLQAKIELLKKSVGVDNVYDDEDEDEDDNEITLIKKYAGLNPTKIISSEDNDIMD
jgi:hypothetical protein